MQVLFCSVTFEQFTLFVELTYFVYLFGYLQGLIPAIETLFPSVEHKDCVKHIYNNFKVDHQGLELKDALWKCAVATTVREFERCMQYIKDLDEKTYEYLANQKLLYGSCGITVSMEQQLSKLDYMEVYLLLLQIMSKQIFPIQIV